MADAKRVSYSKCYVPKEENNFIPEYLLFLLKNKKTKKYTNYTKFYKNNSN